MKYLCSAIVSVVFVLGVWSSASAQTEVTLLAPQPLKAPFDKLIPSFESKSGYKVTVKYARTLETKVQIAHGGDFDVAIMVPPYAEALASGNVVAESATTLVSFVQTLVVKKGAPKPDISTPDAVKRTLLATNSISQVDPANGAVGVSANQMIENLGLTQRLQPRIKIYKTQDVAEASVAMGETEICLCPYLNDPIETGVDDLGPMPRDVSIPTDVVAFVSTHAKDSAAAKALVNYLSSPDVAVVYNEERMKAAH
jgi:molybdate transport system substrate-binding protein